MFCFLGDHDWLYILDLTDKNNPVETARICKDCHKREMKVNGVWIQVTGFITTDMDEIKRIERISDIFKQVTSMGY